MSAAGPQLVAFVLSSHLGRSHAFYSGVLGLKRVEESSMANVYDANGTPLRVMLVASHKPQPYTVLGFYVPDVRSAKAELEDRGMTFKRYEGYDADEEGVWTSPTGAQIAWFEDPDGNIISLSQPPSGRSASAHSSSSRT
jgi:catechol 2,3-dioxygenase-like lactoylglutathione lyase family enzyme